MNRKAILIEASNVKGETLLPGAKKDVDNWKAFLKSPLGGFWAEEEITVLTKPSSFSVSLLLGMFTESDRYCFVAFSGHGTNGNVVLNDTEKSVSYATLTPRSGKGTLIIDSCRGAANAVAFAKAGGVVRNSIYEGAHSAPLSASNGMPSFSYKDAWLTALKAAKSGKVTMLSCSEGQSANEDPSSGGYYTSLLMEGARKWEQITPKQVEIFTTKNAHDYAALKLPQQQKPEYKPPNLSFPFAVKLPPPPPHLYRQY